MLPPSCVKHTYKFKSKTSLLDLTLKLVSPCASHIMSLSGPYPALKLSLSFPYLTFSSPYFVLILALSLPYLSWLMSLSLPYPSWLLSLSCPFLVLILPNSCPYLVLILTLSWRKHYQFQNPGYNAVCAWQKRCLIRRCVHKVCTGREGW